MLDFEITVHLYKVSIYYQLLGELRKAKAFKRAAMTLDGFGHFIEDCLEKNNLMNLPGVGHSIYRAVEEIIKTGKLSLEEELATHFPHFIAELAAVPHIGSRLLKRLSQIDKGIQNLHSALDNSRITLSAASVESLENYLESSDPRNKEFIGIPFPIALTIAEEIQKTLDDFELTLVGQTIMKCDRVKSIDFLTTTPNLKKIETVLARNRQCISIQNVSCNKLETIIFPNIPCTIKTVSESQRFFCAFLTSSTPEHIEDIKLYAEKCGYQLREDGIFHGRKNILDDCTSEKGIYTSLGLDYIPPEIRHLPLVKAMHLTKTLMESSSLKGDFHTHTSASDGIDTIETMLAKSQSLGYQYLAITDHSESLRVANGLTVGEVLRQISQIDIINANKTTTRLLKGIELEILADGSLDFPTEILTEFDLVIAAVHVNTRMDFHRMTQRILKAIRNPNVHILAHPTGRLTSRPGNFFTPRDRYDFDLDLVLKECAANHVALEINAFPERLDLSSKDVQRALSYGAKITIGSDAHAESHLSLVKYGVDVARNAGCKQSDVLNTMDWKEARKYLRAKPMTTLALTSQDNPHLESKTSHLWRSLNQHDMTSLFKDLIDNKKTVVGIDLTASEERDTGWAALIGQNAETRRLGTDKEIIDATMEKSPDLISIDSPLALPYGRCCVKTTCKCKKYGITRFCERFLMSLGIGVFPCLIPSMVDLTMRGIRLAKAFSYRGIPVIESYPGAAQDILGIPRKQRGVSLLQASLERFGINVKDTVLSHDELDAITSALVGYFYLSDQYLGLGDDRENYLIVPSMSAFDRKEGKGSVIAIAGETGAGKSTASLYLALKYGFKYVRYSYIIAKLAKIKGNYDKEELQKAGLKLHEELGQREITMKLIESLPKDAHVVIDGIRWVEDFQTLKDHFGTRLKAIMIDCPQKLIKERLKKSPFFIGKTQKNIEEVLTHKVESEIITLGFHLSTRIENAGSFKSYYGKLDSVVRNL
jgi:histidinol phosphatase-like PHP family hydrolase/predicted nuclease with RNAse H fold/DNA polymerase/3'-5' exonuclease PolX/dephospho-CoA kinase